MKRSSFSLRPLTEVVSELFAFLGGMADEWQSGADGQMALNGVTRKMKTCCNVVLC